MLSTFCRITVDDLNAIANRIEMRTSNMVSVEPICADCKQDVIDCYNNTQLPSDIIKCWDTVGKLMTSMNWYLNTIIFCTIEQSRKENFVYNLQEALISRKCP